MTTGAGEPSETAEAEKTYLAAAASAWETARAIEPQRGIDRAEVGALRTALAPLIAAQPAAFAGLGEADRADADASLALLFSRAAAVAFAAGDDAAGRAWVDVAERHARDDVQRAALAAALDDPERHRMLAHGRWLIAHEKDRAARALWKRLAKGPADDGITRAAKLELAAPRPIDRAPPLWRFNGFGVTFFGSRDRHDDGTYVTTHCVSALFIPVIPLGAYRVAGGNGHYRVFAREQLSSFARGARLAVIAVVLMTAGVIGVHSYLRDPDRLARHRFDDAIALEHGADREAALRGLDTELGGPDLEHVDDHRAADAGAAVVRLSAAYVATPFARDALDAAGRVVTRYQGLPPRAREGAARDAMLTALDGWIGTLGASDDLAAKVALLRRELDVADEAGKAAIRAKVSAARLAFADAQATDAPIDVLAVLVEDPSDGAAIARAGQIVTKLADAPSLLEDNQAEVDAWRQGQNLDDPLRQKVEAQLALAKTSRAEAEADGVTPAQLAAMQAKRPWDQRVALLLAHADVDAGKPEAADARLRAFGPPGMLVRDVRLALGEIAEARGKLDDADQILSALIASRLPRFVTAVAAFQTAQKELGAQLDQRLETGALPQDLITQLDSATEADQHTLVERWVTDQMGNDANVNRLRDAALVYADVVPQAIAAGAVELRRAQGLSGAAKDAMLKAAEQKFLAIKTQAEGQPEFDLALGEIYARLGKRAESDEELGRVLDKKDPELSLAVANVYRNLGGVERAKQVTKDVFETATSPAKEAAASMLGRLTAGNDDESEGWYQKADQHDPFVRTALLELEGGRLARQGRSAECAARFADAAAAYLATVSMTNAVGYNNAAVAQQRRFECSGDLDALTDAEATMARAYKATGDDPIVVGNYASMLESDGDLRVLARRIDVRRLQVSQEDADVLVGLLLEGSEGDAVLAELAADRGVRRGEDLMTHFELLAPNNPSPFFAEFRSAATVRDEVREAAIVARARQAKLDTSEYREGYRRSLAGEVDAETLQSLDSRVTWLDQALAAKDLDARTRAAGELLRATALGARGIMRGDADQLALARQEAAAAEKLWPALPTHTYVAGERLDEAGVRADATRWSKLRRVRTAEAALVKLVDANDPLADTIRASKLWAEVLAAARADTTRPGLEDLRIARLTGDAELVARTRAVLDDKSVHLRAELDTLLTPSDTADEDLAYLGRR